MIQVTIRGVCDLKLRIAVSSYLEFGRIPLPIFYQLIMNFVQIQNQIGKLIDLPYIASVSIEEIPY